jgi:hypothetical protein
MRNVLFLVDNNCHVLMYSTPFEQIIVFSTKVRVGFKAHNNLNSHLVFLEGSLVFLCLRLYNYNSIKCTFRYLLK